MCPRQPDKRVRLRRLDRGYTPTPDVDEPARHQIDCGCGAAACVESQERLRRRRSYKPRRGSWETVDGRFELAWASSRSGAIKSRPDGPLRLFDRHTMRESWHLNMSEALREVLRVRMREEWEGAGARWAAEDAQDVQTRAGRAGGADARGAGRSSAAGQARAVSERDERGAATPSTSRAGWRGPSGSERGGRRKGR